MPADGDRHQLHHALVTEKFLCPLCKSNVFEQEHSAWTGLPRQ